MVQDASSLHVHKPLSFNVLCVLAFGFGGITILVNLYLLFSGSLSDYYRQIEFIVRLVGSSAINTGAIYQVTGLLLSILAFLGVIQMWNLMRSGFWIFSLSKILYLILPFLLLDMPGRHIAYLMMPFFIILAFFIILFSYNLRYLE